jgi:hypothetical protein
MDETEMAAFHLVQPSFKILLIVCPGEIIRNPVSQGRKGTLFPRMIMIKIHKIS